MRTQGDDRAVGGVHKGVVRAHDHALSMDAVALRIWRAELGHCVPAADIAPGAGKGNNRYVGMVLHHRIVNAFGATCGKSLGLRAHKLTIARGSGHGLAAGLQYVGGVLLQGGQQGRGAAQKYAPVPQRAAGQQQSLRLVQRGFFGKALHCKAAVRPDCTLADIAVSGTGETGADAKGDDGACLSGSARFFYRLSKGLGIRNMVVRGAKQQQGIGRRGKRRYGHGSSRVARHRLQQDDALDARGLHCLCD